ncbi:hypothetical protein [Flavobacterium sp.]|uniref:hypothetical protein n=1 Tax=Flavobacterium sp. TaxID=239 RepID=UPI003751AB09
MKKNILLATMLFGLAISVQAQDISKNAIGLRLGDNDGFGTEVSYQARLSPKNRLELDLGFRNNNNENNIKLAGLYQWVWNIDGGFNWYAGVGGGIGSWRYDNNNGVTDNGSFAFAAGDVGIEYNFDFPLQLSLDVRPELYFASNSYVDNNFGPDVALGVRYRF